MTIRRIVNRRPLLEERPGLSRGDLQQLDSGLNRNSQEDIVRGAFDETVAQQEEIDAARLGITDEAIANIEDIFGGFNTRIDNLINQLTSTDFSAPNLDSFSQAIRDIGLTIPVDPFSDIERNRLQGQFRGNTARDTRNNIRSAQQSAAARGIVGSPVLEAEAQLNQFGSQAINQNVIDLMQQQREINTASNLQRGGLIGGLEGQLATLNTQGELGADRNLLTSLGLAGDIGTSATGLNLQGINQQAGLGILGLPTPTDFSGFATDLVGIMQSEEMQELALALEEAGRPDLFEQIFQGLQGIFSQFSSSERARAALGGIQPFVYGR